MCYSDDYERPQLHDEGFITTRKPHECCACDVPIAAGSPALRNKGRYYHGEWFQYYMCEECHRLMCSLAADELRRGCDWREAWCGLSELAQERRDRTEAGTLPVMLQGTMREVRQQVDDAWKAACGQRKAGVA
jgi:hypothetical protein